MFSIPNIPDTIAREIYAELCRTLPPPPDDTPERRAIREQHAMTTVTHLLPENAAEATLAAQISSRTNAAGGGRGRAPRQPA